MVLWLEDTIWALLHSSVLGNISEVKYDNGASLSIIGSMVLVKYNTGDQIWFENVNCKYQVYRILTNDYLTFKG